MKNYLLTILVYFIASTSFANELSKPQLDAFGILWTAMSEKAKVDYPNHAAGEAGSTTTRCVVENATRIELNNIIASGPTGPILSPSLTDLADSIVARPATQDCIAAELK